MRVSDGLEPFPSRSVLKSILDYIMYGVGVMAPLALLPQIIQIYSTKSGAGVSLLTWSLITCVNTMWGIYALVHKDKHILLANSLLFCFDIVIVTGLLIYR